jgi:predicted ATPase
MLRKSKAPDRGPYRIVLTGGPGGGKTTAGDLFRREMGDRVVLVAEAATMMFSGGFPRVKEPEAVHSVQRAIYHVQIHLEAAVVSQHPNQILLCDRGTVDGAAYWPSGPDGFFEDLGTTLERELSRYDAVIFFESAAMGHMNIEGNNPVRTESQEQAMKLDHKLRALWSQHPHFILVPNNVSFFKKISFGLAVLDELVAKLSGKVKAANKERKAKAK